MPPGKVRKPARSLARRAYRQATKRKLNQMKKAAREQFIKAARQFEKLTVKEGKTRKGNPKESIESVAEIKLLPENQRAMHEIMQSLEQGMLPIRFRKLKLNQAEKAELFKLLLKFYQEGITVKSSEWKRLEHLIKTGQKGRNKSKRSIKGNITDIRMIRHKMEERKKGYRKTG